MHSRTQVVGSKPLNLGCDVYCCNCPFARGKIIQRHNNRVCARARARACEPGIGICQGSYSVWLKRSGQIDLGGAATRMMNAGCP